MAMDDKNAGKLETIESAPAPAQVPVPTMSIATGCILALPYIVVAVAPLLAFWRFGSSGAAGMDLSGCLRMYSGPSIFFYVACIAAAVSLICRKRSAIWPCSFVAVWGGLQLASITLKAAEGSRLDSIQVTARIVFLVVTLVLLGTVWSLRRRGLLRH